MNKLYIFTIVAFPFSEFLLFGEEKKEIKGKNWKKIVAKRFCPSIFTSNNVSVGLTLSYFK